MWLGGVGRLSKANWEESRKSNPTLLCWMHSLPLVHWLKGLKVTNSQDNIPPNSRRSHSCSCNKHMILVQKSLRKAVLLSGIHLTLLNIDHSLCPPKRSWLATLGKNGFKGGSGTRLHVLSYRLVLLLGLVLHSQAPGHHWSPDSAAFCFFFFLFWCATIKSSIK